MKQHNTDVNYLDQLRKIHSMKLEDNYDQFDADVVWMKHKIQYNPVTGNSNHLALRHFSHYKIKNCFFKGRRILYLKTPVVNIVHVIENKTRFQIGGYYLFVKSSDLKSKLLHVIKKWDYLTILDRKKVLLQFTDYKQDYWNEKLLTVFEFDKFVRSGGGIKTKIYNDLVDHVGIGVDHDPYRLMQKKAKICFEITMHHYRAEITYVRLVARQVEFL
tara:strand:- start:2029 stop:2679 length:651 start_codon:yes stop_codon:yes gene_type:complete